MFTCRCIRRTGSCSCGREANYSQSRREGHRGLDAAPHTEHPTIWLLGRLGVRRCGARTRSVAARGHGLTRGHALLKTALLIAHHSPLITHHSPLTTHHSPLATHRSPLTAHRSLLTAHSSPLTTYRSPLHRSPPAAHDDLLALHVPAARSEFSRLFLDGRVESGSFWEWHRGWWAAAQAAPGCVLWIRFEDMKADLIEVGGLGEEVSLFLLLYFVVN